MTAFEAVGRGSIPRWGNEVEKVPGVWWMHATLRWS